MVALWYGLILLPLIAIPVLWWNYRRRQEARERQASMRWSDMVTGTLKPPGAAAPAPVAPVNFCSQDRLLDPAQTLVYLLLKSGLPEHEILTQVSLQRVLTLPAGAANPEREQRLRTLSMHVADFVICDKNMRPVAVLDVRDPESSGAEQTFRSAALAQAGIRHVRFARTALPKRHAVRALVLGD